LATLPPYSSGAFRRIRYEALTTTIFEVTCGISFLNSSYLTVLSLILLVVVRGGLPMVAHRLPLFHVLAGLMVVNSIVYALYPMLISRASVWVLLGAKTISTGIFAGNFSLQILLIIRLFGASQCGKVQASLGISSAVGFGVGPVIGYYLHVMSAHNGTPDRRSFDTFFYICALVSVLGVINVILMGIGQFRSNTDESETQKPSDSKTDEAHCRHGTNVEVAQGSP